MSSPELSPPLAALLANELRSARTDVVRRWLDRIVARVTIEPQAIFPTEALLNHVPLLVDGIAEHLERGDNAGDANESM